MNSPAKQVYFRQKFRNTVISQAMRTYGHALDQIMLIVRATLTVVVSGNKVKS